MANFALLGAAGYVAPRHLRAIRDTGHRLVAACDRSDSVGVLDRFFPEARFFTETERLDRFLEKLRRRGADERVDYVSICTPNYLHDAHVRLALRVGATAICEKPLVISPWNLDQLAALEAEYGKRVFTVLQLRLHPALLALREQLGASTRAHQVELTYVTPRGPWYQRSWKGSKEKSGGLAMNIGIHLFDLLTWLFGPVERGEVHLATPTRTGGALSLKRATASFYLSVDGADLPEARRAAGKQAFRSLTVDGVTTEFSEGFAELHTRVYADAMAGRGLGIEDSRPSVELVHRLTHAETVRPSDVVHPFVRAALERS